MVEVRGSIARVNLFYQIYFVHSVFFKCVHIVFFRIFLRVPVHVQKSCRQEFGSGEALSEVGRLVYLLYHFVRYHFACLVVDRVQFEYVRMHGPAFHYLREKLDEVMLYVGPGQTFVFYVRKEAMQAVAEFVEVCLYVVYRELRRGIADRFGEVAREGYDRYLPYTVFV